MCSSDLLSDRDRELLAFTRGLIRLFRAHPVLRRRRFFQGRRIRGSTVKDLTWYGPDGHEMTDEQWGAAGVHAIGLRLAGDAIDERGLRGERVMDDTLLMVLNAAEGEAGFRLPNGGGAEWELVLDTRDLRPPMLEDGERHEGGSTYQVAGRSVVVLRLTRE